MKTDFESIQTVEVCGPGDTYNETEFVVGLRCTSPSFGGCFNHVTGYGEPPSGPEFELTTIALSVPHVNYKGETLKTERLELSYHQFRALVGIEVAEKLFDAAQDEAAESGEF